MVKNDCKELVKELFKDSVLEGEYKDYFGDAPVTFVLCFDRAGMYAYFSVQYPGYSATYFRGRYLKASEIKTLYPLDGKHVGTVKELTHVPFKDLILY